MQVEIVGEFGDFSSVVLARPGARDVLRTIAADGGGGGDQAEERHRHGILVAPAAQGIARLLIDFGFARFQSRPDIVEDPAFELDAVNIILAPLEQRQEGREDGVLDVAELEFGGDEVADFDQGRVARQAQRHFKRAQG